MTTRTFKKNKVSKKIHFFNFFGDFFDFVPFIAVYGFSKPGALQVATWHRKMTSGAEICTE